MDMPWMHEGDKGQVALGLVPLAWAQVPEV